MLREDESIGYHHIFSAPGCKNDYFRNVIRGKGFTATVDLPVNIPKSAQQRNTCGPYAYTASALALSPPNRTIENSYNNCSPLVHEPRGITRG